MYYSIISGWVNDATTNRKMQERGVFKFIWSLLASRAGESNGNYLRYTLLRPVEALLKKLPKNFYAPTHQPVEFSSLSYYNV